MRTEDDVRVKLKAARVVRGDMHYSTSMLGLIYLEGVIDILEWMLGNKSELPFGEHDLVAPGGRQ